MRRDLLVTPSEIIRKAKEFAGYSDDDMSKIGRKSAVDINDLLTVFNFVENSSPSSDKALMGGIRLFNNVVDGNYGLARNAANIIIEACEASVREEQEYYEENKKGVRK